jgi:hypothetical protein
LFGGHLLLSQALTPTSALAAPTQPPAATAATAPAPATAASDHALSDGYNDGHYRCMYRCDERGRGSYGYDRYDRGRRDGYSQGPDRYDRYRNRDCWYRDHWGWHRCGDHWRYRGYGAAEPQP